MKHCHLYFTARPLSVKSLANQIAGFFKVQYLKKKVRDEVDFLYVNQHQSFLQGSIIVLA